MIGENRLWRPNEALIPTARRCQVVRPHHRSGRARSRHRFADASTDTALVTPAAD
jgi:hypothetical protein